MTSPSVPTVHSPIPDSPASSAPVVVRALESRDAERWDRFVLEQPVGTFFYQIAWKRVVEKTFELATTIWKRMQLGITHSRTARCAVVP
jgi:hypothetical protein